MKLKGNENPEYASNSNQLAIVYLKKGSNDKAEQYFLETLKIREKIFNGRHPVFANSCNNLGNFYSEIGKYDKAETLYLIALKIRADNPGKSHPDYAQTANSLADLYRKTGQYEKAEPLAMLAKEIREKNPGKEHPTYAISCTNLANLYRDMGQYEKAEENYIEAKNIREKVFSNLHPDYAQSCNILADLYTTMGKYPEAEALYLEAMKVREKTLGKEHRDYGQSCNNLGSLYLDTKQYDKAEQFLLQARSIWQKALKDDDPALAINKTKLATLHLLQGNYSMAETSYKEALQFWEEKTGKEHPSYIQNAYGLAKVYWNLHKPDKANELYKQALKSQYQQINQLFRFTSESEKQQYINNIAGSSDENLSFYFQEKSGNNAREAYDISLLNRNLILSAAQSQRQFIHQANNPALLEIYDEWIKVKQQIASLAIQPNVSFDEIKLVQTKADSLEKELTRRSSSVEKLHKSVNWKFVQQSLKAKEASIEFVNFKYFNGQRWTDSTFYVAILIRKDKPAPELILLYEKKQLDSLLNKKLMKNIVSRGLKITKAPQNLIAIYSLIWKRLEKKLDNISTIYFAPSGDLFKIPFAALSKDGKEVLSDNYHLVQLSTTAAIMDKEESFASIKRGDKIQLYGGIQFEAESSGLNHNSLNNYNPEDPAVSDSLPASDEGFSFLPGTQTEVLEIKQLADSNGLEATVASGNYATEGSFKSLNNTSTGVIHIATHGFFFPDPKEVKNGINSNFQNGGKIFRESSNPLFRSGLLFAGGNFSWRKNVGTGGEDGIITAYEVSNMYFPNTKLVVLSACETALGDISGTEGVYGLQRAFKIAGVQNLIMSLWQVPDRETSEFMQLFYKNFFEGKSITDAFAVTQKSMKNKYRNEPYKWAAWILVR